MENANYGKKQERDSKYVIVAPHAAGDDIHSGDIAEKVAEILQASLVVNERFVKPNNSNALENLVNVEDFNRLSCKKKKNNDGEVIGHEYNWENKKPEMKKFYDDIQAYVQDAKKHGNPVVVYIHGMRDGQDDVGIDIGYGVKHNDQGKLVSAKKHPEAGKNSGVRRASYKQISKVKESLKQGLKNQESNYKVGIAQAKRKNAQGKNIEFAAWSRSNGIQFHAGDENVASFQLEICKSLRDKPDYCAKLIANAILAGYEN